MASPYFYKMNVAQADFSGIERGGKAMGDAFKAAGDAFGEIGAAYFEQEGVKNAAKDFLMSTDGEAYLSQKNFDPKTIAELKQDPKKAEQHVQRAMNAAGGIDKFKEAFLRKQQDQRNELLQAEQLENAKKTNKKLGYALNDLADQKKSKEVTDKLYGYIFKKQDDGSVKADVNNMLINMDPSEAREGYEIMQSLGMNNMNFGSFISSLKETNPDIVSYPNRMMGALSNAMALYPQMGGEDQKRMQDMLPDHIIEPANITKSAKDYWSSNKLNDTRRESMQQMDTLQINIKSAIGVDANGKNYIKNNPAAATAMRNFARVANGVGVMTDKDVSSVGGPKNVGAVYDRFMNTYFSGPEREATAEDVRNGYADKVGEIITINSGAIVTPEDLILMRDATVEIEKYTKSKLQDAGVATQEHLRKTFSTLSNDRLLELNPYAEHFNDAYTMQVEANQWPVLDRFWRTNGEEALKESLLKSHPRMQDSQFQSIMNTLQQEEMASEATPVTENSGTVDPIQVKNQGQEGDDNSTGAVDPGAVDPTREDRLSTAEKVVKGGAFAAGTLTGGALINKGYDKLFQVGTNMADKRIDKLRLTPAAEKLLPQKIKNAIKANPAAIFEKHGGMGDVAKKYGIKNTHRLTPDTLQKKVILEIKDDMRAKLAQLGGKSLMAKFRKILTPDKLGKRLIPYAGAALVMGDIVDISELLDGKPEEIAKQQDVMQQKMMSAGVNPLELLVVAQALDELMVDEMSVGVGVNAIANRLRGVGAGLLEENNVGKNLDAYRSALGKATEIKPMPKRSSTIRNLLQGTRN